VTTVTSVTAYWWFMRVRGTLDSILLVRIIRGSIHTHPSSVTDGN
jgi:hypothetical protein